MDELLLGDPVGLVGVEPGEDLLKGRLGAVVAAEVAGQAQEQAHLFLLAAGPDDLRAREGPGAV